MVIHEWTGKRVEGRLRQSWKLLAFCYDFRGQQGYSALPVAVAEREHLSARDRHQHELTDGGDWFQQHGDAAVSLWTVAVENGNRALCV